MKKLLFAVLSAIVLIFSTSSHDAERSVCGNTEALNSIEMTEGLFSCNWSDLFIEDILCRTIPQASTSARRINPSVLCDAPLSISSVKVRYPYNTPQLFKNGALISFNSSSLYSIGQLRI